MLAVFDALADGGDSGLTMAELSRTLSAPKSSLFPILHTMADAGYLAYDEATTRYAIGLKAYLLGRAFDHEGSELRLIEAEMRRVTDACGETCQLGILERGRVLYVAKVDSPQYVRLSSGIGKTLPAEQTAIGKALLSGMGEDAAGEDERLARELRDVREAGFAYDREEVLEGVQCIAVPLRARGSVAYGLGVSTPSYRLDAEKEAQIRQLLSEARGRLEPALA